MRYKPPYSSNVNDNAYDSNAYQSYYADPTWYNRDNDTNGLPYNSSMPVKIPAFTCNEDTVVLFVLFDIIVIASNFEQHLRRVDMVLGRIKEAGLKLKPEKCQ
jgi:hypothetical protein